MENPSNGSPHRRRSSSSASFPRPPLLSEWTTLSAADPEDYLNAPLATCNHRDHSAPSLATPAPPSFNADLELLSSSTSTPGTRGKDLLDAPDPDLRLPASSTTRFFTLAARANHLIEKHGRYYYHSGRFERASNGSKYAGISPHWRRVRSYSAAQEAIMATRLAGQMVIDSDLKVFEALFETATQLLWEVNAEGVLDSSTWAWGVYGITAGMVGPPSPSSMSRKARLYDALTAPPTTSPIRSREIHTLGKVLLEKVLGSMNLVKMFHVVMVLGGWLRRLGREELVELDWVDIAAAVALPKEN